MPYDFRDKYVETFAGINDISEAPTASKAGNASHLIALHNDLAQATGYALNQLETASSKRCTVTAENYVAEPGCRVVLCDVGSTPLTVYFPETGEPGDELTFLHLNSTHPVTLLATSGNPFIFKGTTTMSLTFTIDYQFVSLIYVGHPTYAPSMLGWVPNQNVFVAA